MANLDDLLREHAALRVRVAYIERVLAESDQPVATGSGRDLIRRYRALFPTAMKSTVVCFLQSGRCPPGAAPILAALRLIYGPAGPSRATVYRALSQQSHRETT